MKNSTRFLFFSLLLLLLHCDVLPTSNTVYRPGRTVSVTHNEAKEFDDLMKKDKTRETADVLNYLLNEDDPDDPFTAIVLENTSNCNIIVRLVSVGGAQIYNLPVPENGKNHFKISKGNYTLRSNVCDAKYYSQKNISESIVVKISQR